MLEGSLHDFSLPDVLRLLAFTSKTGRLALTDGTRRGRVDLLDGRVRDASADATRLPLARRVLGADLLDADTLVAALADDEVLPTDLQLARRLAGAPGLDTSALADLVREQTVDATFDLLRWHEGTFRFDGSADEARGPSALDLALGIDELLDETSRRLDVWPSLVDRTGPTEGVVSIRRPGRDHAEVALPPDGWTLLSLVDGRRTLADLVDLCGQGEYRTRRALGALVDEGVIAVGDGDGLGPGERLLRDHAALAAREDALAPLVTTADATPPAPPVAPGAPASPVASDPAATAAGPAPASPVTSELPSVPPPAPPAPAAAADEEPAAAAAADEEPAPEAAEEPAAAESSTADEAPAAVDAPSSLADRLAADAEAAAPDDPPPTPSSSPPEERPAAAQGSERSRVRPLRTRVRDERLRTDPTVDEDLVDRLIAGVEGL